MRDSRSPMRVALSLSHFRRRVADNYARARAAGGGAEAWTAWRADRDALFASHPQSPVPEGARAAFRGMGFFPYDPSWRLTAVVEPIPADARGALPLPGASQPSGAPPAEVSSPHGEFRVVGTVVAVRGNDEIRLPLLWLDAYGGGLFMPFRDATNGEETYGGGRYLIDQAKGADLGMTDDGRLVLDFNYAYQPSCAHDPRWTCPLAPADARVQVPVTAGELAP